MTDESNDPKSIDDALARLARFAADMPRIDPDPSLHAIAVELEDRIRERAVKARRFLSRSQARIPKSVLQGALAGWRDPWSADPKPTVTLRGVLAVLCGSVGIGKSSVAARWALLDRQPQTVRWIDASELDGRREGAEALIEWTAADYQRVVIDDLGRCGTREAQRIADLCILRHDRGHRTCVTTNLSESELRTMLGSRFADRVTDWQTFTGESKRTGPEAARWAEEMATMQHRLEHWAKPLAVAAAMLHDAINDDRVTPAILHGVANLDTREGTPDRVWLQQRMGTK